MEFKKIVLALLLSFGVVAPVCAAESSCNYDNREMQEKKILTTEEVQAILRKPNLNEEADVEKLFDWIQKKIQEWNEDQLSPQDLGLTASAFNALEKYTVNYQSNIYNESIKNGLV